MGKLNGKVALVTGGSRGIGKAVALAYVREGAKVFICARDEDKLMVAANEIYRISSDVNYLAVDIAKPRDVKKMVREIKRSFGTIHILVNNASILGPRIPIARYPLTAWNEVFKVNLVGLFVLTKEVLEIMIQQKEGSIINVSSGVGRNGKAYWGAYAASKFGVEGFTQILADEVKDHNIRVNAVNPGGTRTDMRAEAYPQEDPLTLLAPDEITGVFVHLASSDSKGVTGQSLDARDWLNSR